MQENSTSSMTILDSVGQNRFKSGFFIDNFTSVGLQDNTIGIKNSFWVGAACFTYLFIYSILSKRILIKKGITYDA